MLPASITGFFPCLSVCICLAECGLGNIGNAIGIGNLNYRITSYNVCYTKLLRCTHNKLLVFLARFWEGSLKIGKFALIGLVIEVVALMFIPNAWITNLLEGNEITSIITLTLASVPLHLPQVTAASMLFGFYLPEPGQVIPLAKGAGIALLIGGPVTALPVVGVFISMFKPRVLMLYVSYNFV